jgi:hypothetical protein
MSFCASCNRAFSEKDPVAGVCNSCRQYVCTKCSEKETLCALCGRVVCSRSQCSTMYHEKPV